MAHPTPALAHVRRRGPVLGALAIACALLLSACGGGAGTDDASPTGGTDTGATTVVATTTILGDVAAAIAPDDAEVIVLMPPGTDPHNFEPSARQLAEMQQADLIVANGGGLEVQLDAALDEAAQAGVPVFRAVDHVDLLAYEPGAEHEAEHGGSEHDDGGSEHAGDADHADGGEGTIDPHVWTDPLRMADVARALGERLDALAGGDGDAVARADAYAEDLAALDRETAQVLAVVPEDRRTLVTNHEAFAYFADRYGFTVVGTVIPGVSTGAEPSARDLEDLAATIRAQDVSAIFAEASAPTELAQTLADEVGAGVRVVALYSESLDEPGSDAATYIDMVRVNAQRIADALAPAGASATADPGAGT